MKKISLVVPIYNEEDTIQLFYKVVRKDKFLSGNNVDIIFINDGSSDKSEEIVRSLIENDPFVTLVNLSRNFGKEKALFAGLSVNNADLVVPIDVDLQDPIELIEVMYQMIENEKIDIVLAKRADRSSDSFFKRKTAELFYKIHNSISDVKLESNVGDFRMMKNQVVDTIVKMPESQLFMKGIFAWVGFRIGVVEYKREGRVAGHSKFNSWKLWNLAVEGITSFSTIPLKIWVYLGSCISLFSFIYAMKLIFSKIIFGNAVAGYPSIMVAILFLGGIQLIGIGVLGEYMGRCYMESKNRPKYVIREIVKYQEKNSEY